MYSFSLGLSELLVLFVYALLLALPMAMILFAIRLIQKQHYRLV